ncbi:MAG TPA: NAD(P)-binding domain-containing protein [Candidatus Acidoferrum sp.]|nr:NAD(P)-binding domain-containing protein [Candidatus Acidoferrum sp.]
MNDVTVADAIVALVTHARRVPADQRTEFAARLRGALPHGAVVLETCHRVEAYVPWPGDPRALARDIGLPDGGIVLEGEAAVRQAIGVAVGADSVVLGEDQVLHQLREVVDGSRASGGLDPTIGRLFAVALQAGRRARSWHQGPRHSLADVALAAIEGRIGPLRGRPVLIVGAGQMGRLAVRAAIHAGATVSIANRSGDAADALARATGSDVEAFDPGPAVGRIPAVIVAIGGPWSIGEATAVALRNGSTVVVDLSVPAALPAQVAGYLGNRHISADDLAIAAASTPSPARDVSARRAEELVSETTAAYVAWLDGRPSRAVAEALVARSDREREAELAALWRRLPDLEPDARDAIEGMTRHLAKRLLREPLERLGRDADGTNERAVRDIFAL